jgi:hypothetical protein
MNELISGRKHINMRLFLARFYAIKKIKQQNDSYTTKRLYVSLIKIRLVSLE